MRPGTAFSSNTSQQISFGDGLGVLADRDGRVLAGSCAQALVDEVFPAINEARLAVLYDASTAARSPVNVLVGAMIASVLFGYTDDGLVAEQSAE